MSASTTRPSGPDGSPHGTTPRRRSAMTDTIATLYIDGAWVPSSSGETRTIVCPADQSEVGVVSEATGEDVERAIGAARRAFEGRVWADTPASERGDLDRKSTRLNSSHV